MNVKRIKSFIESAIEKINLHFYLTQIRKKLLCNINCNYIYFFLLKAIARVHRQISEENAPQLNSDTTPALTAQLQVSTAQVSLFNLFFYIIILIIS